MDCGTIVVELSSNPGGRFETAKTAFRLHVNAEKDAEELTEMMVNLREMQRGLKELKTTAEQETPHLVYAQSPLASLRQRQVGAEHPPRPIDKRDHPAADLCSTLS